MDSKLENENKNFKADENKKNPEEQFENYNYSKTNEELIKNYFEEMQSQGWRRQEIPANAQIIEEKILKLNGDFRVVSYLKGKFIGKGGFAKCYEFTNLETKHVSAVKVVDKASLFKSRAKQKLISEIKIHKSLNYLNIVHFEHYFEDSENVYLLLEICENQSLNELLKRRKRISELEAVFYLFQITNALKYLRSHRIIHRDLKLGNLFLSEKMDLKVGDFGLATKLDYEGERRRTVCGTPNYIAPEILDGKLGHSYEVDIWAVGVILYTLLIGKPPFETSDVKYTYKRIKNNDYSFPENIVISDPARNLIQEILVTDPNSRPSLDEILTSDFMNIGNIPNSLPTSTLAVPPTISYIKQYWPEASSLGIVNTPTVRNKNISTQSTHIYYNDIKFQNNSIPTGENTQKENIFIIKTPIQTKSEIIIEKWIDYSSKYGMGYILSNGSIGVYFNDCSKVVLDPNGKVFHYLERPNEDIVEIMTVHTLDDYPKELYKKVTLLKHFTNYLLSSQRQYDPFTNPPNKREYYQSRDLDKEKEKEKEKDKEKEKEKEKDKDKDKILIKLDNYSKNPINIEKYLDTNHDNYFVYLKKWMRTKQAFLFRLSNKIVQVVFKDQTQIILSSQTKELTYININGDREKYPLFNAQESSNIDMVRRLKYTKDILSNMLNLNRQKNAKKNEDDNTKTASISVHVIKKDSNKENEPNLINTLKYK